MDEAVEKVVSVFETKLKEQSALNLKKGVTVACGAILAKLAENKPDSEKLEAIKEFCERMVSNGKN